MTSEIKFEQISQLNERVKLKVAPSKIEGVGVHALRDIKKGEKIRYEDLTLKAPGDGLTARHRAYFINKKAIRDLPRDYQIKTKDVK